MSLRDYLKKRLAVDYAKAPNKIYNQNNLELKWSDKEKLYIGFDAKGEEWIAALQFTTVPIFSVPCTNLIKKNGMEVKCASVNFRPICDSNSIKCRKCKQTYTGKINIDPSSVAYDIWKKLDV